MVTDDIVRGVDEVLLKGMNGWFVSWVINALALAVTTYLIPGMEARDGIALVVAALVLGLVNSILRPLLIVLTLPLTMLTLGLFALFINALMLFLVSAVVPGFDVVGLGTAFIGAIVLSLVGAVFAAILR